MTDNADMRDPTLDEAWRAHSQELPPNELDQAILAAAHRAVGSTPTGVDASSTRPWRWWMPLMAAAAIGAVAIGVLQLSPPERDATTAVVTDLPSPSREAAKTSEIASPVPERHALPDASTEPSSSPRVLAAPRPSAPSPSVTAEKSKRAPPVERDDRARDNRATRDAPPAPQAFPEQKTERRALEEEPALAASPAPAAASAPPPSVGAAAPVQRSEKQIDRSQADARARAPAERQSPPAGLASGRMQDEARVQRLPADWIARLRMLRASGINDEAARDLAAFRAAYPDADARLPDDLRAWAASIPR